MVIFLLKKSLFFENRDFFEKKPKNRVNFYPQKMAIFQKKWKSWYLHCPAIFQKNLRIKTGGPKNDPPGGQKSTPRVDLFPEHFLPGRAKIPVVTTSFFDDRPLVDRRPTFFWTRHFFENRRGSKRRFFVKV